MKSTPLCIIPVWEKNFARIPERRADNNFLLNVDLFDSHFREKFARAHKKVFLFRYLVVD